MTHYIISPVVAGAKNLLTTAAAVSLSAAAAVMRRARRLKTTATTTTVVASPAVLQKLTGGFPPQNGVNIADFPRLTGETADTARILRAIAYAAGRTVYFYNATYTLSPALSTPAGTNLMGQSNTGTWLKGELVWTSNSNFTDLRIGDTGTSTKNLHPATSSYTRFLRCRFRGGGGSTSTRNACVLMVGNHYASANNIHFDYCDIERNLGTEDATFTREYNDITVFELGYSQTTNAAHLEYIYFDHCNIGVANGATIGTGSTGSPRMGCECYCSDMQASQGHPYPNLVYHGWHHLYFRYCEWEPSDACLLDLPSARLVSDPSVHACHDAYVTGCNFKGGGVAGGTAAGSKWGYCIAMEGAHDVVFDGNTFGRSADTCVSTGGGGWNDYGGVTWVPSRNVVLRNNVWDFTTANGITVGAWPKLRLLGNSLAEHNTFNINVGSGPTINVGHDLSGREAIGVHVHHNTVNEYRTSSIPAVVHMENCDDTVIGGTGEENTFRNVNATSDPVIDKETSSIDETVVNFLEHA